MGRSVISEGRTTSEAIKNGLKELNASKNDVEIKVINEETKKSFFDILAPRVVKVELTLKEEKEIKRIREDVVADISEQDFNIIKSNIETFLNDFIKTINLGNIEYNVINEKKDVKVEIDGENVNPLIGYRGEALNAFQTIISRIGNKGLEYKHMILLDVSGYREKRIRVLEDLAVKVSKTVERKRKSITLEPMNAFERKIIHNKLQENPKVTTHSVFSWFF